MTRFPPTSPLLPLVTILQRQAEPWERVTATSAVPAKGLPRKFNSLLGEGAQILARGWPSVKSHLYFPISTAMVWGDSYPSSARPVLCPCYGLWTTSPIILFPSHHWLLAQSPKGTQSELLESKTAESESRSFCKLLWNPTFMRPSLSQ